MDIICTEFQNEPAFFPITRITNILLYEYGIIRLYEDIFPVGVNTYG